MFVVYYKLYILRWVIWLFPVTCLFQVSCNPPYMYIYFLQQYSKKRCCFICKSEKLGAHLCTCTCIMYTLRPYLIINRSDKPPKFLLHRWVWYVLQWGKSVKGRPANNCLWLYLSWHVEVVLFESICHLAKCVKAVDFLSLFKAKAFLWLVTFLHTHTQHTPKSITGNGYPKVNSVYWLI